MMHTIRGLPKKELISVLELINELSSCETPNKAEALLVRVRDLLKADCAVCGTGSIDERGVVKLKTIVDAGYPGEWLELYFKEGLYKFDPVVRYHRQFSEPELWSNIRKGLTDERSQAVTEWAGEYGLKYGLSSSVYIPAMGMFSLFCFASAEDVFTERHKELLSALTLHLNKAITESSGEIHSILDAKTDKKPLIQ